MGKHNAHAPEILTHINDAEHGRGGVFEPNKVRSDSAHPKVKEGCYANAEGKSEK